ncbi:MAG: sigma-70 family RNA polymerase sigma factor [Anaerovoracaceae bacterium]
MTREDRVELLCSKYNQVYEHLSACKVPSSDCDDLAQEVFISAYMALDQLRDDQKIMGWLGVIAINKMKKYGKKKNKECLSLVLLEEEDTTVLANKYKDEAVENYVINELVRLESNKILCGAVESLDEQTKLVIKLQYGAGYSLKEIGEMYQINYNTVKSLHLRGLKKLAKLLKVTRERDSGK